MKIRTALALLALVFCFASNVSAQKRPLAIDDFAKMKKVSDPRVSPDGKWVAYTVTETDLKEDKNETRVWMAPAAGGDAIPMTAKGYSASSPRWSPDGKYLAFVASRGKGKDGEPSPAQVYTLNRLGGEAQAVTNVKWGVDGFEWAPDSTRLVLVIRDPKPEELTEDKEDDKKPKPAVIDRLQFKRDYVGYLDRLRTHLYVQQLGVEDAKPVQITSGDFDDSDPAWSPDGKSIAFVSNRTSEPDGNPNSDIWVVAADNADKGGTLLQVTTGPREDSSPAWSPDGQSIAFVTITAPLKVLWYATNNLAVVSAKGGAPTILTAGLDRNIGNPKFSADGKSVWVTLEDSAEQNLAAINVASKVLTRVITGSATVHGFDEAGGTLATLISKPDLPDEVFTGAQPKQLTFTNKKLLDSIQLADVENITYKSKDGMPIEAFIFKPVGFNPSMKYPAILHNHGGPVSQYDFSFDLTAQVYAAAGYVVIHANPRGSSGYGQAFSYALNADWGNLDVQDVMAGVDEVIARGYVDPERLGVGGWSYGGILTNYCITQSTRFKGAVSGASEALYRANYGHDHYQMWWEVELGLPWANVEGWERLSPFNKVDKITTPTLWMGGAQDWNVPILNSEQMYQGMKRLGRETQLVVYPGEYHGLRRPTFLKDRFERAIAWYDKYVKRSGK